MESGKCGGLLGALLFGGGSGGGAGGGTMYVEFTEADGVKTLNKNFKEITDAVAAEMAVIIHSHQIVPTEGVDISVDAYSSLSMTGSFDGHYEVVFGTGGQAESFSASSETAPLTKIRVLTQ